MELSSSTHSTDSNSSKRFKTLAHIGTELYSQHPGRPIFSESILFEKYNIINPYQLFAVDPLHVFHLGISKMLLNTLNEYLRCKTRQTRSLGRDSNTFVFVYNYRLSIFRQLNAFIDSVTCDSDGIRISCAITRDGGKTGISGFFGEDSVVGMLQASHYKRMDNISPFFGALIDRACDNVTDCPITSVLTSYVLMLQKILYTPFSDEIDINVHATDIKKDISEFKTLATTTLGRYQTSGFGTVKWHLLEHVPQDIRQLGSLLNCDTGFYEESHKLFKFFYYYFTNKRRSDSYENTIDCLSRAISNQIISMQQVRKESGENDNVLARKKEVIEKGIPRATAYWFSCSLHNLSSMVNTDGSFQTLRMSLSFMTAEFFNYLQHISSTAAKSLIRCLNELLVENNISPYLRGRMTLRFSRSPFLLNRPCPVLSDMNEGRVFSCPSVKKSVRRIQASHQYYGSDLGRYDTVFVRSKDASINGEDRDEVWFAKIISIVSLEPPAHNCVFNRENCSLNGIENCSECNPEALGTFAFVQYFDVIDDSEIPIDNIEKKLDCIRLKWSRGHSDIQRDIDSGKEFGCFIFQAYLELCT